MYRRPKIEDFIDDPDRNGSDGSYIAFYQHEEEEYLEALERYCDALESIGGPQFLLRAREEEIEDATDGLVDWEKYISRRNASGLYDICASYYADKNTSDKNIKIMAMFYDLLAQEESKQ